MGNTENGILITIKKPYAEAIFSGEKRWEIRKRAPLASPPYRALVCVSGTSGEIWGEFTVDEVRRLTPREAIDTVLPECGVPAAYIHAYARTTGSVSFLHVAQAKRYTSDADGPTHIRQLGVQRAPQSWQYLAKPE